MTTFQKIGLGVLGLCAVLGAASFFGLTATGQHLLGSAGNAAETYYNSQWLVGGNQIGPTGTLNLNSQFGTCNLIETGTIAATSTAQYDCAVTGIQPGDTVFEDPSATQATGVLGDIFPIRAVASTTAGYVTFTFLNLSGAASTTLGAQVSKGVEYVSFR